MSPPKLSINAMLAINAKVAAIQIESSLKNSHMTITVPQLNLILAWGWIVLGFVSGMVLGTNFHREDWLGGYGSFKRRLLRLGHISFFGLGTVNLLFYITVLNLPGRSSNLALTGWLFVLGAVAMPLCCVSTAFFPKLRPLFGIPVVSLISGGLLLISILIKI